MGGQNWAGHTNEVLTHTQSAVTGTRCPGKDQLSQWMSTSHTHTHTHWYAHAHTQLALMCIQCRVCPKVPAVWHTVSGLSILLCTNVKQNKCLLKFWRFLSPDNKNNKKNSNSHKPTAFCVCFLTWYVAPWQRHNNRSDAITFYIEVISDYPSAPADTFTFSCPQVKAIPFESDIC